MKWFESWKEDRLRTKEELKESRELLNIYKEMIRQKKLNHR